MSSSPSNNNQLNGDRARLTEKEKKQNHIVSEQKRRQAIRAGFDRLAILIPGMEGQGRSEAVVLESAVKYDDTNLRRKRKLEKLLVEGKGVPPADFNAAYKIESTVPKEEQNIKGEDSTSD